VSAWWKPSPNKARFEGLQPEPGRTPSMDAPERNSLGRVDQIVHGQECLEPALPFLTHGMAFILHVEVSVLCYQHPAGMRLPAGRASDAITLAKMWAPKGLKRDL